MKSYDVLIVGGGAAGLSAALVLGRARRSVAVVDAGEPRNAPAAHLQGFLSRDGMPPAELLAEGRGELTGYGVALLSGTVAGVHPATGVAPGSAEIAERESEPRPVTAGFRVHLADGDRIAARRIIVATGLQDVLPEIPGLRERWGRDVLHCPYCHGYEVRDRPLGVLGGSPEAVHHALLVRQWSDDIVLFGQGVPVTAEAARSLAARRIRVVDLPVTGIAVAGDRLTGVVLSDGSAVPRDALFVRTRMIPNAALLSELDCDVDDQGWVVRDAAGATSVRGVWAVGNAANPRAQVITAAGEGSAAATAVNADLVEEDIRLALLEWGGLRSVRP